MLYSLLPLHFRLLSVPAADLPVHPVLAMVRLCGDADLPAPPVEFPVRYHASATGAKPRLFSGRSPTSIPDAFEDTVQTCPIEPGGAVL